jgi:hypothetical protein
MYLQSSYYSSIKQTGSYRIGLIFLSNNKIVEKAKNFSIYADINYITVELALMSP